MQRNEQFLQRQQDLVNNGRLLASARQTYTKAAIFTLLLYFVFAPAGLIANIIYLIKAKETEKLSGRAPEGKKFLLILLWIFLSTLIILTIGNVMLIILLQAQK